MAKVFQATQNTTGKYTAVLKDESGVVVPASAVDSLTLTLTDLASGAVINGRNVQNVFNVNGVTLDASGNLTWTVAAADNPVLDSALRHEAHLAVFVAKFGAREIDFSVILCVENLSKSCFACRLLND